MSTKVPQPSSEHLFECHEQNRFKQHQSWGGEGAVHSKQCLNTLIQNSRVLELVFFNTGQRMGLS